MNKYLKWLLIAINAVTLLVALYWFQKQREPEPLIVICGQAAALIALFCENRFAKIVSRRIANSKLKIAVKSGDQVHTSRVSDSDIHIKTK